MLLLLSHLFLPLTVLFFVFVLGDVEIDIEFLYKAVPQLAKVFRIIDKIGEGSLFCSLNFKHGFKRYHCLGLIFSCYFIIIGAEDVSWYMNLCIRYIQLSVPGWSADAWWEQREVCAEAPHPHQPSYTHCCWASVSHCCRVSFIHIWLKVMSSQLCVCLLCFNRLLTPFLNRTQQPTCMFFCRQSVCCGSHPVGSHC